MPFFMKKISASVSLLGFVEAFRRIGGLELKNPEQSGIMSSIIELTVTVELMDMQGIKYY